MAAVITALPVAAYVAYYPSVNSTAILPQALPPGHNMDLDVMIGRLAARLQREPGDAEGWVLLGRSYQETGRYPQAVEAYTQAAKLLPHDASVQAGLADVRMIAAGGKWTDTARASSADRGQDPPNVTELRAIMRRSAP
jgi:cytochrome c-type biogenesis protein CcmH